MSSIPPASRKEQALALLRANRLGEAKSLCEEVCRSENAPGAWHLLGIIHGMLGCLPEAERCYHKAIEIKTDYAEAHRGLGDILRQQGRLVEAIASLQEAVLLDPGNAETHFNLGMALAGDNRLDEAAEHFDKAIHLQPGHVAAHLHLGIAHAAKGNLEIALNCFREVLRLQPKHPRAHAFIGNTLVGRGDLEQAAVSYRQVLSVQPDDAETLNNLGNVLSDLNRKDEAIETYRQAIAHNSRYIGFYHNLGHVLIDLNRVTESIGVYRDALRIDPGHPVILADLGVALSMQGNHNEAIACYRQSLEKTPDDAETRYNLGNALWSSGQLPAAIESYDAAIRLRPDYADAHVNLGLVHLLLGHFRDGWNEFSWQWRREGAPVRLFPPSAWDGSDLAGRNVFLHEEQGLGDELFFLRFVPWLKKQGAGIIVYRPNPKIASMLMRVKTLDRVAARNECPSDSDMVFSVGDLPRLLGMEHPEQIPPPFELTPLPERIVAAQQRLNKCGPPPYIGVTWRAGTTKKNAVHKETPFSGIALALKDVPGTVLVLQRNPLAGEIDAFAQMLRRPTHDFSDLNDDLEGMLALLALIDEYVGVSNTNMLLRAGVGKTARVLVPAPAEWRWMAHGKESPWMPGFNIYRQGHDESWGQALNDLRDDLWQSLVRS